MRYCFLLLKYRKRSEAELKKRLSQKKIDLNVRDQVIADLKRKGFVSTDIEFAFEWADYRLSCGYGINRIVADLLSKGITRDIIEDVRGEFLRQKRESVKKAIRVLIDKKTRNEILDYAKKQKMIRYIVSRGFLFREAMEVFDEM